MSRASIGIRASRPVDPSWLWRPPNVPPGTLNFTHPNMWEVIDADNANVTYTGMRDGGWTASQITPSQSSGFKLRGVGPWVNGFTATTMFIYVTGQAQFDTGNGRALNLGVYKGPNTYRPSSMIIPCTTTPASILWSYNMPLTPNEYNFLIPTDPNGTFVTDYSIHYIGFLNPSILPP